MMLFSLCLAVVLVPLSTARISVTVPAETEVTVDEHESLSIYCNATSGVTNTTRVTWLRLDGSNNVTLLHRGPNVTLTNITRRQAGRYMCNATTSNATVIWSNATTSNTTVIWSNATTSNTTVIWSNAITIHVRYQPSIAFISNNQAVNEGTPTMLLRCNAIGYPVPNVTWTLPWGELRVGNTLSLVNVTRAYGGRYTCNGSNIMGVDVRNTYLNVQYRPMINKSAELEVVNSWLHKNTTLTCLTSGNPTPNVTWYKDGQSLTRFTQQGQWTIQLTISSSDQFGNYTCEATNALGNDSRQIWLKRSRFQPSSPHIRNNRTVIQSTTLNLTWTPPYNGGSAITYYTVWQRSVLPNGSVTTWVPLNRTTARTYVIHLPRGEVWGIAVSATNEQGNSRLGPNKNFTVASVPSHKNKIENNYGTIIYSTVGAVTFIIVLIIIVAIVVCVRRKPAPIKKPNRLGGKEDSMMIELNDRIKPDRYSVVVRPRGDSVQEDEPQGYQTPSQASQEQELYANVNAAYSCNHGDWEISFAHVEIDKVIGKGAFCQVAKAFVFGLGTVAAKMVKDKGSKSSRRDLLAEYELLSKIGFHDNVIRLMGAVTLTDPIMILFEYVPYGDLLGYLRKSRGLSDTYYKDPDVEPASSLTSQQLLRFAREAADGMAFLAQNKIIHRDLAARNVLVGQGEKCKITDFGMARDVFNDDIYQKRTRGRLPVKWTAYEALLYGFYTTQSDVWSYGVVLYEIFTIGGCPYPNQDGHNIAQMLQSGYRMPRPTHVDNEIYALMMECWTTEPERRPTFDAISSTLHRLESTQQELIYLNEYDGSLYANLDEKWD